MDFDYEKFAVVHVASYHSDRQTDFNEKNTGLAIRLRKPDRPYAFEAGSYKNSYYKDSIYIAVSREWWKPLDWFSIGLFGALVTGYRYEVAPVLLPEMILGGNHVSAIFHYAPNIGDYAEEFASVSLRIKF